MRTIHKIWVQLIGGAALLEFYCLAVLWPLGNKLAIFATATLGVMFFLFLCARLLRNSEPGRLAVICLALMLAFSAVVVIIIHQEKFSLYSVNALASAGMVLVLDLIKPIHLRIALYVAVGVFGWLVCQKVDLDESIIAIGQNGITLHVLVLYIAYFFRIQYRLKVSVSRFLKYENYIFAAALFTLAVWSQGRSATVAALTILCVAAFILMREFAGKKKYLIVLGSLLIVLFNFFLPPLMGERPYSAVDRIAMNGVSDIRYAVWVDYIQTLTPESLMIGNRDSNCHNILQGYRRDNCNVHSSYLRGHQVYGLFGIIVIFLMIFRCFSGLVQRGDWAVIPIVLALLARVATDEAFFVEPYLFTLFFIYTKVKGSAQSRIDGWSHK